ncbi:MAG: hypothetical protein ABSH22_07015 [Tepidisphaeraceae bacterium]|jgi:hypothetical protein
MSTQHMFVRSTVALLILIAVGCTQTQTAAPTTQAMAAPQTALVVNYPNGGGTTVFLKSPDNGDPIMLCTAGTTVCPECKAAAIKYFQTGVLDPHCSRTGATRYVTNFVTPDYAHN